MTTIHRARRIITMDPNRPYATHVAVRDGRILAVGDADCADAWGGGEQDDTFADSVLMPGFVEGHAHLMTGAMWDYTYAGDRDRTDPDGRVHPGMPDVATLVAGLSKVAGDDAIIAWGFDPIFLTEKRLDRADLDRVSTDRPVAVIHSNFHLMTVNSKALELVGYTRDSNLEGLLRDSDGEPNGELQEMGVMFPLMRRLGINFRQLARTERCVRAFGRSAQRTGCTTSTDLFSELPDEDVDELLRITGADDYPMRLVPAVNGLTEAADVVRERVLSLRSRSTEKLRMGAVKLMADGSIQGFTARVKWPGYIEGQPNGIWNQPPDQLSAQIVDLHGAGVQMHIHVNGDEASEAALDGLEAAIRTHGGGDHRHVLQHCQMMDRAQFERAARLGACVNLFSNHIWYFGDAHVERTIGLERAERMNGARAALDAGCTLAIHSDSPVTPMGPLHVAWAAVNRRTPSGRVLGERQRISVAEALEAITLGAARTLKMDGEVGSIAVGKRADFAVLGDDPEAVDPSALRDVEVRGTVLGGRPFLL